MKRFALLLLVLPLAGCASPQERLEHSAGIYHHVGSSKGPEHNSFAGFGNEDWSPGYAH